MVDKSETSQAYCLVKIQNCLVKCLNECVVGQLEAISFYQPMYSCGFQLHYVFNLCPKKKKKVSDFLSLVYERSSQRQYVMILQRHYVFNNENNEANFRLAL